MAQLDDTCEISEIRVPDLKRQPFDEQMIEKRMEDIQTGDTNKDEYRMAKQFAAADFIVIAAPYWDDSFPSVLKVYLEHICVNTITFSYGSGGKPVKLCHANRLVYITTAGGNIKENSGV